MFDDLKQRSGFGDGPAGSSRRPRRRVLVAAGAAALALGISIGATVGQGVADDEGPKAKRAGAKAAEAVADGVEASRNHGGTRPNIVLIQTDDLAKALFKREFMPKTHKFLLDKGTSFTNYSTTTPVCCPSRAALISGQYNHTNKVLSNGNGYPALINKQRILPVWLDKAGYRTAHIGKYMQRYKDARGIRPDRGWDEWFTVLEKETYFDYDVSRNGERIEYGDDPADHQDTVLGRKAKSLARKYSERPSPFFMQIDFRAPHTDGTHDRAPCKRAPAPARRDERRFEGLPLPMSPGWHETDVSDKPAWVRAAARHKRKRGRITQMYRCGARALLTVDRGVNQLIKVLRKNDEIDRTVFIFTSDNGLAYGEHQLGPVKAVPYEEVTQVPLIIRAPSRYLGEGFSDDTPDEVGLASANIDLAPTILELAGTDACVGKKCRRLDGRSLVPLLRSENDAWPADRGIAYEMRAKKGGGRRPCKFRAIRVEGAVLIHTTSQSTGGPRGCQPASAWEFYDLEADPYQLENLYKDPTPEQQATIDEIRPRMRALRDCSGIEGREPPAANRPFCE